MKTPRNLEEAKELADKYDFITLEQIKKEWLGSGFATVKFLTGFGGTNSCSLCGGSCSKCIHGETKRGNYGCLSYKSRKSYYAINNAETPEDTFKALKVRARYLRRLITKFE